MSEIHEIDPNSVIIPPRQRGFFDQGYIEDLAKNIKAVGQLQPGICRRDENSNAVLVAGECRLRACKLAAVPYRFYYKEDITDPAMLFECELMENLLRRPLTWKEEVDSKAKLHELRQSQRGGTAAGKRGGHTIEDTANELHESKGLVSEDIKLAMFAQEIPEVANASSKAEAKKIVKRIEAEYHRATQLEEVVKKNKATATANGQDNSSLSAVELRLLEYDKRILPGDFDLVELEGPFDIVFFDPPWGVDYDKNALIGGSQVAYEDDREDFLKSFPQRIAKLYNLMAEHAHLYVFFGITHHEFVYSTLEAAGFTTNRIPLIWQKQGSHRTRNPKVWPGRSYEPIAYARKGGKDLMRQGAPDVITTPQPTPKIKQSHPSAKHPMVYRELLLRSGKPGDRVLDPMAGSCMLGVACDNLKAELALDWTLVELNEDFRNLGIFNCNKGYWAIVDDQSGQDPDVEVVDDGVDFKKLTPGTSEWANYWRLHPEKQNEMIEFRRAQGAYNG